ncbi:tetratricopeptide repeat protein [Azospirillum aestuarii]|uniref:tetratricopeptide repeat protein n=1 Tax=Azospirillum aestuarii TaxID=2802052 RepID=UPI0040551C0A
MARIPYPSTFLAVTVLAMACPASAQDHSMHRPLKTEVKPFTEMGTGATGPLDASVDLLDGLGTLSWPVTTASPQAQAFFDQGLRLSYAFNHGEAGRAFRKAQSLDPACAMCFWGEALVLGPNINWPMEPDANAPALAALRQAQAHAAHATDRERALIDALARRYAEDAPADRKALDAAYADAMAEVAKRFPEDAQIAVLTAEAMMNLTPWDYWADAGRTPKGSTADIVATLERVLASDPEHPGAIHYYIHMVEASDRPERAEPHADRLGRLMPAAGHIVHMPSHIYYRVGRYKDSLEANRGAVAADEAYLARVKAAGLYPGAYYPHNIHFLMVSAQMAGDGPTVVASADKLARTVTEEAARTIPWVQPIKAAPYFAHAQYSAPAIVLALPDPGDELPYVKALWHYARGVAQAAAGNGAEAGREAEAIDAIVRTTDFTGLDAAGIPADRIATLSRHVVLARIAQARGDLETALEEFREAATIEDTLSYMEPPYWYYPVRQSLGAVLLQTGQAAEAERAFRASLTKTPHNGWALYGLTEALRAQGRTAEAEQTAERLARSWAGDRSQLALSRL